MTENQQNVEFGAEILQFAELDREIIAK